ncbi:MAG: phosphoglucosamine mutase [Bryobacteraceae bacterium]|nr:phosphoglucosamine mutase [Bryobacteraceae bacterium]
MERHLFGTDGIRGVAGSYPLDPQTTFIIGAALGAWLRKNNQDGAVAIGMDTRESSTWIAEHVTGGLAEQGIGTRFAGLITTPGVAYVTRQGSFSLGVMISASHNPYQDNGIKVIGHSGFKLPDAAEHEIEREIFDLLDRGVTPKPLALQVDEGLDAEYLNSLANSFPGGLEGLRLLVDCANGAASKLAPELLRRLGADVTAIHCQPDGRNINLNCGSLHLDALREKMSGLGADAGIAFDGDADRALFVSKAGKVIDGDAVMLITGVHLHGQGRLAAAGGKPVVVATVMSNLGLEVALKSHGIEMVRTPVGDKYVLEEMVRRGAALGGEQSGHIIFREYATMGDGMLTALRVLDVMRSTRQGLDELSSEFRVFPQLLVNVRVKERKPLAELPRVQNAIREAEAAFGGAGRVVVRFSGTEPLARVMIEAGDRASVETWCQRIAGAIREEIGA